MRAVGVKAEEGQLVVNAVLRQQPRDQLFSDTTFLAADQVNRCHAVLLRERYLRLHRHCAGLTASPAASAQRLAAAASRSLASDG